MKNMIKNWLAILFLMFLVETGSSFKIQNNINEEEAIHLAEQFIIDNGYTTLPANKSNHFTLKRFVLVKM